MTCMVAQDPRPNGSEYPWDVNIVTFPLLCLQRLTLALSPVLAKLVQELFAPTICIASYIQAIGRVNGQQISCTSAHCDAILWWQVVATTYLR